MGIDAVAILRIAGLPTPQTGFGTTYHVVHRGDATLVNTMVRFEACQPDEHALALRRLVGAALDAHDDPRGILFFADTGYPRADTYDAMVEEMASGGVWTPKVAADYVPMRYRAASVDTHDALVGQMIAVMGRDAAIQLDLLTEVQRMMIASKPADADALASYRAKVAEIAAAMSTAFAARYDASLTVKVDAYLRAAAQRRPILLDEPDGQ